MSTVMDAATPPPDSPQKAQPRRLTILYDEQCALCLRCRDWLLQQRCLVEVELLPSRSRAARERYGSLVWAKDELVVIDDRRRAWVGPAAFLMCLWATARYRAWSFRLARGPVAPLVRKAFASLSRYRTLFSASLSGRRVLCASCGDVDPRTRGNEA